jgi:alpha-ribazole phosphatase/probable phosphoglycerate mutase
MATTLYLIRHGETEGSEEKRYKGTIDVPLSENGKRQILKSAEFIGQKLNSVGARMNAVYSSNLVRASKSAELIAGHLGLKATVDADLRERDFGLWEGMSFEEIDKEYPDDFRAWAKNPLRFSPMGGESTLEVKERVIGALKKILDRHAGETIAVVGHGGVNRVALCHYMDMPLENIFRIEQEFACVNIVEFYDSYPVVKLLNGASV